MSEFLFIHCGDIHLDARFTGTGLNAGKIKERRQELRDTFSRIIDKVIEKKANALFITGDLFEHEYVSKGTIEFIINQVNRISWVKIFISPGNHDPYVANSFYAMLHWPKHVHIFNNTMAYIYLPEYNASIYGVGFGSKVQYESMIKESEEEHKGLISPFNILITHGTFEGVYGECAYHPISADDVSRYHYVAMGHIHKPMQYMDSRIIYSGCPEPIGFDEPGEHGIVFGKVVNKNVELQYIKMNQREYKTIELDISNITTIEYIEEYIQKNLEKQQKNLVKIILKGRRAKELELDVELLRSRCWDFCYYLKIIDETIPDYHLESLRRQYNLTGFFVQKVLTEIEKTQDEKERQKLYKALYLGLEALEGVG